MWVEGGCEGGGRRDGKEGDSSHTQQNYHSWLEKEKVNLSLGLVLCWWWASDLFGYIRRHIKGLVHGMVQGGKGGMVKGGKEWYKEVRNGTRREGMVQGGKEWYREGRNGTRRGGMVQGGKEWYREGRNGTGRGVMVIRTHWLQDMA